MADSVEAALGQENTYDFAGRMKSNEFGLGSGYTQPYKQTLGYDAFTNITSRSTQTAGQSAANYTAGFTNNRRSSGGYGSGTNTFDIAGNIVSNSILGT